MFFSVVTKNLNWEILTKNLVAFKRCDMVKDGKSKYYEDALKNLIFQIGGLWKTNIQGLNCLKRRDLESLQI